MCCRTYFRARNEPKKTKKVPASLLFLREPFSLSIRLIRLYFEFYDNDAKIQSLCYHSKKREQKLFLLPAPRQANTRHGVLKILHTHKEHVESIGAVGS